MKRAREHGEGGGGGGGHGHGSGTPGKRTLTAGLVSARRREPAADPGAVAIPDGGGAPLPAAQRDGFERSLGVDLGDVRVHTGAASAEAAADLGARAFAVGSDVHFGAGEYAPATTAGAELLAHEVAHTVQQRGGAPSTQAKLEVSAPGDAHEREADVAAAAMVRGEPARVSEGSVQIARQVGPRQPAPAAPAPAPGNGGAPAPAGGQPAAGGLSASLFDAPTGSAPTLDGANVEVHVPRPGNTEQAAVSAPRVHFHASVALAPGATLPAGPPVQVGVIQTLLSTDRTVVWRQNGPGTPVVAEQRIGLANVRDAEATLHPGAPLTIDAPAPWYVQPHPVTDSSRQVEVAYHDRPEIYASILRATGRISETRGHDRFHTMLVARQGDETVQLDAFQWEVPWAAQVPFQGDATAGQVGLGDLTPGAGQLPGAGPSIHERQGTATHVQYASLAAAMAESSSTLLHQYFNNLQAGERGATTIIAQALRHKNPRFAFWIGAHHAASSLHSRDDVRLTIVGHRQIQRTVALREAPSGQPELREDEEVAFSLLDVVDPERMELSSFLHLMAYCTNTMTGAATKYVVWPQPWADPPQVPIYMDGGSGTLRPYDDGNGVYVITGLRVNG